MTVGCRLKRSAGNESTHRIVAFKKAIFAIITLHSLFDCCLPTAPHRSLLVHAAWTGTYPTKIVSSAVLRRSRVALTMSSTSSSRQSSSSESGVKKRIAIIGGGVAGLSCAERLTQGRGSSWLDVTVFDTGRIRPGGRSSSRQPNDPPKESAAPDEVAHPVLSKFRYDHAAQVVHVDFERFPEFSRHVVEHWVPAGILQPFPPHSLIRLESSRRRHDVQQSVVVPTSSSTTTATSGKTVPAYYYAPRGMGSLVTEGMVAASAGRYSLRQDVWISPSNGARYQRSNKEKEGGGEVALSSSSPGLWVLQAKGRKQGQFDEIVIAHNGKCADRLMSSSPAKQVHQLLRVNFASTVSRTSKKMVLNSLYSWTFAVAKDASVLSRALGNSDDGSFRCGFVQNCDNIRFLTCQSNKLDQDKNCQETELYEVWTVLSSPAFAKAHKAPQESLGLDVIANVTQLLGESLETYLELPPKSVTRSIVDQRLQLWGAGLPLNIHQNGGRGFVYHSEFGVGVCGDWLLDPSVAGAWTSGYRLADHLLSSSGDSPPPTRGLEITDGAPFVRSDAASQAGIGSLQSPSMSKATSHSSRNKSPSYSASSASATSRSSRSSLSPSGERRPRQRAPSQ